MCAYYLTLLDLLYQFGTGSELVLPVSRFQQNSAFSAELVVLPKSTEYIYPNFLKSVGSFAEVYRIKSYAMHDIVCVLVTGWFRCPPYQQIGCAVARAWLSRNMRILWCHEMRWDIAWSPRFVQQFIWFWCISEMEFRGRVGEYSHGILYGNVLCNLFDDSSRPPGGENQNAMNP